MVKEATAADVDCSKIGNQINIEVVSQQTSSSGATRSPGLSHCFACEFPRDFACSEAAGSLCRWGWGV
jgi:hypothetical protein